MIRLRSPSQYPGFEDLIHGFIKPKQTPRGVDRKFFDDPVLLKSDGSPTYHLANVVDDHLMDISHVVRAAEWLPSTPKHVQLYHAFGWKPPHFVHAGLLTDPAGQKLSKRKADIDCISYMKEGVLPESLVNFVALLGWSHSRKEDRMSMEQLIENVSGR